MSRASDWATTYVQSRYETSKVKEQRPPQSPYTYLIGHGVFLHFTVTDEGWPHLIIQDNQKSPPIVASEIKWEDDLRKLLETARWLLDTFGDETQTSEGWHGPCGPKPKI